MSNIVLIDAGKEKMDAQNNKIGSVVKKRYVLGFVLALAIISISLGPIMSQVEQAGYSVVEKIGAIEIRDYNPRIVAETEVAGPRKEAIQQGFRVIADYIFGNNVSSAKIAMTAPVMQQSGENISMTAPVTQTGEGAGPWKINFVMPSSYTLKNLPRPANSAVVLKQIPSKRYAVIRFSGMPTQEELSSQRSQLEYLISQKNLRSLSPPIYAFFNPPWTLPILRRNEIMIEVNR